MANIDTLTEALYKLIHTLAGDSVTDAEIEKAVESMSFSEVCEKLVEEVSDGDLALANGASTLATLNDIDLTSPTNGQVLIYNATAEKWENGGIVGLPTVTADDNGKVLKVVNGAWTAVEETAAE